MNFYAHHIGDFNSATMHLTRVERSVYRDAIERYYEIEQPLPADDIALLARRLRCVTDEEKAALGQVLKEFFHLKDGFYHHVRCDIEIAKYRANNTAKAKAGKASAEARALLRSALKEQNSTPVEQTLNGCSTHEQLTSNHEPITSNHEPITSNQLKDSSPTGCLSPPVDPVPFEEIVALYHETLPTLPRCVKLSEARRGHIRQRHTNDLKSLDRWREYFDAISRSDFLMGRKAGNGDKPPFIADLEWITKQSNFLKIAEGKYHRG